jgi:hypothetical protein
MNTKILGGIVVLAIVAVGAWNVSINLQNNDLSSLSLANVEALAQNENSTLTTYTCWKNIQGGLSPTRLCSGCSPVWFTTGTNVSTCKK